MALAAVMLVALFVVMTQTVATVPFSVASVSAQTGTRVVNSDEYSSIQSAIDDVNRTGGGTVYVPAGVHLLDRKILLYSNITLFGDGMGVTILKFRDGAVLDHMMSNDSLSTRDGNIVVRDLTLSGPGPSTSKYFGLRLVNVQDAAVVNVASDNHGLDGFYLGYYNDQGVNNVRLSGCRATNNGRNGISLTHGSGNIVDNCYVENNNRIERVAGIDLEPDQGLNVSDNKVIGNTARNQNVGVQLYSADRRQYVQGGNAVCANTIRFNSTAGIWDYNGSRNIFVNNAVTDNGGTNQVNLLIDGSAVLSTDTSKYCQLPSLSPAPPKPGSSTTRVPTATVTPTRTPTVAGATLSANPLTVEPNGTERVSWSGIPSPTTGDWIGLYPQGAVDDSTGFLDWKYVSCNQSPTTAKASGSCDFTMRSTLDTFEFRLFANDGYIRLATSNPVTVSGAYTPTPTATATAVTVVSTSVTLTPTSTTVPSPPAPPTRLSARASTGYVHLTWRASSTPNVTYIVYRGTAAGSKTSYATGVISTEYNDRNAQPGVTYYYSVTAVTGGSESGPSNEVSTKAR